MIQTLAFIAEVLTRLAEQNSVLNLSNCIQEARGKIVR